MDFASGGMWPTEIEDAIREYEASQEGELSKFRASKGRVQHANLYRFLHSLDLAARAIVQHGDLSDRQKYALYEVFKSWMKSFPLTEGGYDLLRKRIEEKLEI